MGRIRSLLKRTLRPVAMVGTVGVLSLSMIGAQPAYAADTLTKYRDAKAFEDIIKANFKTIQPVAQTAMVAASFSPIGVGLRVAQLGMLAYSTSDIWMPWFAGAWGEATGEGPSKDIPAGGSTAPVLPNLRMTELIKPDPKTYRAIVHYSGDSMSSGSVGLSLKVSCGANQDGSGRVDLLGTDEAVVVGDTPNYAPRYGSVEYTCPAATPYPLGAVAGRFGTPDVSPYCGPDNSYWPCGKIGPINQLRAGSLLANTSPPFDPYSADTKVKVRSECIAPDGTKSTVESESSGDYLRMPSCAAAGKGHGTGKTSIVGLRPGTTTEQPLWDSPAAPSDPATPLCDASRPTDGCVLTVTKDGQPCTTGDVECENWSEVNQNDPNKDTNSSRMKCKLGPYTVPIAQCRMLEKAFVGGQIWSDANTDGDPSTSGAPSTAPSGSPAAAPAPTTPGTTTGTIPGGAGQTAPDADQKTRNCFPTGWAALNPVEWVLKPLRCAFEPSQNPQDMVTRLGLRSQTKAPISFLNMEMVGPSGGGCPNWTISVPGFTQNVVCGSSFTAAILSVRGPLFGLLATAMVWPLLRSLWYAAIPILRVTPSSGGK